MITNKKATLLSFISLSSSLVFSAEQPTTPPHVKHFLLGLAHGATNGAVRAGIDINGNETKFLIDATSLWLFNEVQKNITGKGFSTMTSHDLMMHGFGQAIGQKLTTSAIAYAQTQEIELSINFDIANTHLVSGLIYSAISPFLQSNKNT